MENINVIVDGKLTAQQLEDYEDQINNSSEEAILAYINYNGEYATPEGFDDSYMGEFENNIDFADEMASNIGPLLTDWPYNCIDWEQASSELMQDYYEENGHYFRA